MKHYGPMHGERSRRHQMERVDCNSKTGLRDTGILTMYETLEPRLAVETMVDNFINKLTFSPAEAREVGDAFLEFADAWRDPAEPEPPVIGERWIRKSAAAPPGTRDQRCAWAWATDGMNVATIMDVQGDEVVFASGPLYSQRLPAFLAEWERP